MKRYKYVNHVKCKYCKEIRWGKFIPKKKKRGVLTCHKEKKHKKTKLKKDCHKYRTFYDHQRITCEDKSMLHLLHHHE